jgi:drug/metabolite transporter (DMT)-like permease
VHRRSLLTLVVVCSGWGTIPLLAGHVDLPPAAIVFARVWIATAVLAVPVFLRGWAPPGPSGPSPARTGRRLLAAGALLAVHWTAMFAGYQYAPDDTVVFIVFLAPVGIALLAPRTLGERLGPRTVAALLSPSPASPSSPARRSSPAPPPAWPGRRCRRPRSWPSSSCPSRWPSSSAGCA